MNVKELRESMGLTQQEMSEELGVTLRTLSRWETGESKPSRMAQRLIDRVTNRIVGGKKIKEAKP